MAQQLAQAIVRDGEGATKFITVQVDGGRDDAECRQVAYAIAHSPLVKTAFFASDPNLGRILAAVGYAGIADLDQSLIDLYLDDVHVAHAGRPPPGLPRGGRPARDEAEPRSPCASTCTAARRSATVWTCDLSHDYVRINADYRTLGACRARCACDSSSRCVGPLYACSLLERAHHEHASHPTTRRAAAGARGSRVRRQCVGVVSAQFAARRIALPSSDLSAFGIASRFR